jgi:hypothetical protein
MPLVGCPTQVHFIIAACENMVHGKGLRPGDVLKSAHGKTVEVNKCVRPALTCWKRVDMMTLLDLLLGCQAAAEIWQRGKLVHRSDELVSLSPPCVVLPCVVFRRLCPAAI